MPRRPTIARGYTRIEQPLDREVFRWKHQAARPDYATDGMKLLRAAGKVSRQEYLEMMLEMDAKHPGNGWKSALDDLEKYYCERDLKLKDKPLMAKPDGEAD